MKIASFPENTFYLFNLHKCKCHRTAQPELQNFSQATFHKRRTPDPKAKFYSPKIERQKEIEIFFIYQDEEMKKAGKVLR